VRRTGFTRIAAALAVAAAALGATGAPASAATQHARMHAFTPRLLPSIALPSGLARRMAQFAPHAAAPLSLASTELLADPESVTVNGVTYQMYMSVFTSPPAFAEPPQLDVELDRTTASGGMLTGEQDHTYDYAPLTGLSLTANAGLTSAHLKTGTSIDPSAMDVRFAATGSVYSTPCSLVTGGRGTFQVATGTLSASTFTLATGTTPFFGDITTAPATATVVHDPGCASFVQDAQSAPIFREPCTGPTLEHSSLTTFWLGQLGVHRGRVAEVGETSTNPFGPGQSHLAIGLGAGADMGPFVHTAKGLRVAVRSKGVPFMGGSSVFVATGAAHVSPGHSCTYERHTLHYTNVRYQGTLTPTGSPIAVRFDTGAMTLGEVHATLWVPRYTAK
jgi:hypothetical protein